MLFYIYILFLASLFLIRILLLSPLYLVYAIFDCESLLIGLLWFDKKNYVFNVVLFLILVFTFVLLGVYSFHLIVLCGGFIMFLSSLLVIYEKDFKKVVTLSTLSQMGFCALILGFGYYFLSYFHFVRHVLFKIRLFILVVFLIHFYYGQQDSRSYHRFFGFNYFLHFQLLICLFSLCGLLLTSGQVSKDLVLEIVFSRTYRCIFVLFSLITVWLTLFYCQQL